ncbi:MAG: hypothetical protein Kilf2KO_39550 [Rhodospirillales bacterium]
MDRTDEESALSIGPCPDRRRLPDSGSQSAKTALTEGSSLTEEWRDPWTDYPENLQASAR